MKKFKQLVKIGFKSLLLLSFLGSLAIAGVYFYLAPDLPSTAVLKDVRFQVPLRIYTEEGVLLGEFGEKKRQPVRFEDIPEQMVKALTSSEDSRFFEHPGVDYQGLMRAAWVLLTTGEKAQGGSTITMQVARNFFLSRKKTYTRKITEILLALKIEQELTKNEILELYLNKIYFGNRAYGVASAAQVYYDKKLETLSLAEIAMIVGLPKAPSTYNPIANAERALLRRNYVLGRMHTLAYINDETYEQAIAEPVTAKLHRQTTKIVAPYVAEMARKHMIKLYGDDAYSAGYKVITTIKKPLQKAANQALQQALFDYDERHGYRGPIQHLDWVGNASPQEWQKYLTKVTSIGPLKPALVIAMEEQRAHLFFNEEKNGVINWSNMKWARTYLSDNRRGPTPKTASDILKIGDIVMVTQTAKDEWRLAQAPTVSGALISLSPKDGAIRALVGGFSFYQSKYNRVTQAKRQPGSSFKPFIYSAALNSGFTAASLINDAPVVFDDPGIEAAWRPENYSGKFFGPTRLREALTRSRNLVSIRLLRSVGVKTALKYIENFGFDTAQLPRDLSLSLGSGVVTPLELARGHATFANGGFAIQPYFIKRIEDARGEVIFTANPPVVCPLCEVTPALHVNPGIDEETLDPIPELNLAPRTISAQNAYIIYSMMKDVVKRGTGRRALKLGRQDIAGKTGTTNDQQDAWFVGFNSKLLAISWVGFDDPRPLGNRETGGRAALPMWLYYMEKALNGVPESSPEQPPDIITVRIDRKTGLRAHSNTPDAMFEVFRGSYIPKRGLKADDSQQIDITTPDTEPLF
ncbi:MAG: penicillin-binding protein 1A [Gammaproteobacteria bacterium]|nr:penicillin-binding protein 1A [Gammaproteobacteria bacterium]